MVIVALCIVLVVGACALILIRREERSEVEEFEIVEV